MRNKSNLKIAVVGLISAVSLCIGGVVANLEKPVKPVKAEELFKNEESITITNNYTIASAAGINDSRSGMLLSANKSGAKLDFATSISGVLELDFRAFTDTKYEPSEKVSGDKISNTTLTLQTFSILITNVANEEESFRIGIEGGSQLNFATPQAYVEVNGRKTGIYEHEGALRGNTTGANSMGRYTALWNTSFTNAAYSSSEVAIDKPESNVICFDPSTMMVYSKSASGYQTLIWDLSQEVIDSQYQQSFQPFETYNVALEFTQVSPTKTANLVLYSLNGQNLSGETLINSIGPSVFANFKQNPVKGEKFYLPSPLTYDICGDAVSSIDVSVRCGAQNLPFYTSAGVTTTKYQEGCYVICGDAVTLDISYTAYDAQYAGKSLNISLPILQNYPSVDFELDKPLQDEYGKGAIVDLPALNIRSDLFRSEPDVVVSIWKDGKAVEGYVEKQFPILFEFNKTGDYEIVYACLDSSIKATYKVSVTDDIPALNLDAELPTTLNMGEDLYIPNATYLSKGTVKQAEVSVKFPDGSVYANKRISTSMGGIYTIVYTATYDEVIYKTEYEVIVLDEAATFISDTGKVTHSARSRMYGAVTGIGLKGATSDIYQYSKIIDLSNSTKDDILVTIYPSADWGTWNPNLPDVILTDAHDPTNVVKIDMNFGWHVYLNYCFISAPDQTPKSTLNGEMWTSSWGAQVYWPGTTSTYSDVAPRDCAVSVQYDAETKSVYLGGVFAIDLDADYQEVAWKGWTTGEVYLSITSCSEVVVTEVYNNKFSEEYYKDSLQPFVKMDLQGYSESELPNAIVGKPYKLFGCAAVDNWDDNITVSTKVFFNYGTERYSEISIKDGMFTPQKAGDYALEYIARDRFGNEYKKVLIVTAINEENVIPVRFSLTENPVANGIMGVGIQLPKITSKMGGSGTLNEKLVMYTPYGNIIEMEEDFFIPDEVGYYTLEYTVSDYIGNGTPNEYTITKTINVQPLDKPILYDNLLPQYILSGATLQLPAIQAIDYFTDNRGVTPEVSITATINGEQLVIQDGKVVPKITTNTEDMIVTYAATNSNGTITKNYVVKVINPQKQAGFMTEYFQVTNGLTVEKSINRSNYILQTVHSGAKLQFINPVLASEFLISMSVGDLEFANVDKITVRLYDYADMNISARFDIIKNVENTAGNSKSYISINGGKLTEISGNFYSVDSAFGFQYKQATKSVQALSGGIVGYVDKTESGKDFNGFTSGKVWVEIEFGTVYDEGILLIMRSLNNQTLSGATVDSIIPEFVTTKAISLIAEVGSEYIVPSVLAQDVLANSCNATVSIEKVGGATIIQNQSAETEVRTTFNENGRYRITYTITESNGQKLYRSYMITIIEHEAPTITVNGTIPKKVSVGETMILEGATVTDNADDAPTLKIFVYNPDGEFSEIVIDSNKTSETYGKYVYNPQLVGIYTLRYYAYDGCSNYVIHEITFLAE